MWNRIWHDTFGSEISSPQRIVWYRWFLTLFGMGLMFATHPLWQSSAAFPQVPWFSWGCTIPPQVDLVLLCGTVGSLVAASCTRINSGRYRISLIAFSASLTCLMLLNQQRSQPWAYQFVLIGLVLATVPAQRAIGLLRLLTVSIYLHSALSKCDYSFCTGLGRSFLLELRDFAAGPLPAGAMPWQTDAWPLVFPLGEFAIAIGLIWPASRRAALWGATGMHLLLLWILGPWGLAHSWGVLLWNGYFIIQNFLFFGAERRNSVSRDMSHSVIKEPRWRSQVFGTVLVAGAALWPCFEPLGYCDLWPAWGLYAQHGEQFQVWVTDNARRRLPVAWQDSATRSLWATDASREWQLRPQQVALQTAAAPLYPQNRFQLGVILKLARSANIPPDEISAEWFFPAHRWTGMRHSQRLNSLSEIERAADQCWFNARPRD